MQKTISILKRLFSEEWKTLLEINLMATVFSLLVITAGPALLAMHGVLIRLADDRCDGSRRAEFWALFKSKFLYGVLLEVIAAVYGFAMLWCLALADRLEGAQQMVLRMLIFVSLFLAAGTGAFFIPLLSGATMRFSSAFWNALRLAFGCFPRTLLSLVTTGAVVLFGAALFPVSIVPLALFVVAAGTAASVAVVWPAIDELIPWEEEPDQSETLSDGWTR